MWLLPKPLTGVLQMARKRKDPAKACMICGEDATEGKMIGSILACGACIELAKINKEWKENTEKVKEKETFASKAKSAKGGAKKPTKEQAEIIEISKSILRMKGGLRALMIEAGAGTGKTTQLRMLADVLPGRGQYTAFNKALVEETKTKFNGTNVACNTTHSLAFRAIGAKYAHRLDSHRMRSDQIANILGLDDVEITLQGGGSKRLSRGFLAFLCMEAIRLFCQSADFELGTSHFKYIDGIDKPMDDGRRGYTNNRRLREYMLPFAEKAWVDIQSLDGQLPFNADHYVKIWQLNSPVISADYILLDEAQDTAPVMLSILEQQKSAALFIVGDSAQQIYEWRGAVNALAAFPGAPRKFLSQSFRFGQAIADVANIVLGSLEEKTPLRLKGLPSIQSRVGHIENPRAILCRTNASAVGKLLAAMANDKKPYLVGGGSDVIAFVNGAKSLQQGQATQHPALACFSTWVEVQEYSKMDEGEDLRLMVKLIDSFGAQVILDALHNMPPEEEADFVISTAHKSKGREWDSVELAEDFPTLSKSDDSDLRLLYVAVTRAKLELNVDKCPAFNGDDSLDIEKVIEATAGAVLEAVQQTDNLIPPAPSEEPPAEFQWAMDKATGKWAVKGASGNSGNVVTVVRKDGSTSSRRLGSVIWERDGISLYRV
jgi:hypothetical protein